MSKWAWIITGLGVLATAAWCVIFFLVSPFYVLPGGIGGLALDALVYGWPFHISAIIAWKLPMEVKAKCFKCKWSELYQLDSPKL